MQAQVINQRIRQGFERLLLECLTSGVQKELLDKFEVHAGYLAALEICGANVHWRAKQLCFGGELSVRNCSGGGAIGPRCALVPASAEQMFGPLGYGIGECSRVLRH